jgi:hypothetical protein
MPASWSAACEERQAMAQFKQSVLINRPVEQVFAFVSDLENDPPWSGGGRAAPYLAASGWGRHDVQAA